MCSPHLLVVFISPHPFCSEWNLLCFDSRRKFMLNLAILPRILDFFTLTFSLKLGTCLSNFGVYVSMMFFSCSVSGSSRLFSPRYCIFAMNLLMVLGVYKFF